MVMTKEVFYLSKSGKMIAMLLAVMVVPPISAMAVEAKEEQSVVDALNKAAMGSKDYYVSYYDSHGGVWVEP